MRRLMLALAFFMIIGPAEACQSLPPASERGGVHWSYRVDRESGRHCWYPDGGRHHTRRSSDRPERPPKPKPAATTYAAEPPTDLLAPPIMLARLFMAVPIVIESDPPDDSVWPEPPSDPEDEALLASVWPEPPPRSHLPTMAIALAGIFGAAAMLWRMLQNSAWCAEWGRREIGWLSQFRVAFLGCKRKYSPLRATS